MDLVVTTPTELQRIVAAAVQQALAGTDRAVQHGKRFLDEGEAASLMGTTASALRSRRCRGKGPVYTKDGGRVIYDVRDIEAYLHARKVRTREN